MSYFYDPSTLFDCKWNILLIRLFVMIYFLQNIRQPNLTEPYSSREELINFFFPVDFHNFENIKVFFPRFESSLLKIVQIQRASDALLNAPSNDTISCFFARMSLPPNWFPNCCKYVSRTFAISTYNTSTVYWSAIVSLYSYMNKSVKRISTYVYCKIAVRWYFE